MESVGSYEAKTHLPQLLERVSQGENIIITKHGVPIAKLVPAQQNSKVDISKLIDEIKHSRRGRTLKPLSIKQMIEEGRKW